MKKVLFLLFLLFVAGAIALSFNIYEKRKIAVVHPVRGPAVQAVYATGTVEPSVMIPIAPRQTARLMTLLADEGLKVSKGQVLAQMEDTDVSKTLAELQSKAVLAQKQYDRALALLKNKAISPENVDQAKSALEAARAAVERTEAQLSYLKLLAPEEGVIIRRDGEAGELIPANQPVFWMSCCAPYRISSEVDEEDISLVQPGQQVVISADAFPGKIFNGTVQSITPKGDPVARSYRVRIGLENQTPLMIGMTAETNIITQEAKDVLLIPASAVRDNKVWAVENGQLHAKTIETGIRTAQAVEVTGGIDEKATIVQTPDDDLEEGKSVATSLRTWNVADLSARR